VHSIIYSNAHRNFSNLNYLIAVSGIIVVAGVEGAVAGAERASAGGVDVVIDGAAVENKEK
jgi:hypothetical protein